MAGSTTGFSCVHEAFHASAAHYPEHDFLHIPAAACAGYAASASERENGITLRYAETAARVDALAQRYRAAGYGPGHRVALVLQNRPDFFLHWFALNGLGTSVVPINDEMATDEQAYILAHSEACLLVHLPELNEKVATLLGSLAQPPATCHSDASGQPPSPPQAAADSPVAVTSECALLYTSGSTGKPKGCILSNEYFLLSGQRYVDLGDLCALRPGQDRLITPLPLVHMNAMACSSLAMVLTGGCLVQLDRFHPRSWWQSVRDSRASVAHYLGVMPAMLLGLPEADDDFSGQLRFAFGAGVNPKHHAPFEARFGFPLVEAWGMTETGNHGAIVASREPRHVGSACFGQVPAHLGIQLVDEQGQVVPEGEPGELLLRHLGDDPHRGFFGGYLKNPEATAEAWAGGWFHTGDVVRRAPDGSMHFVDRRKNVIRRSGENISALEVEAALAEDPAIAMAVVCPVPDEVRGDEVMACVIPTPGADRDQHSAEQIAQRALANLVYFKIPGYVGFYDSLPLTASEKPRRADIKALAAASLAAGECCDVRHLKKRRAQST